MPSGAKGSSGSPGWALRFFGGLRIGPISTGGAPGIGGNAELLSVIGPRIGAEAPKGGTGN